jgi:hypothetical protein
MSPIIAAKAKRACNEAAVILSFLKNKYKMISRERLKEIGFKDIPHFTITNGMLYDLGRKRHLSFGSIGTPNEMLFITQTDYKDRKITDLVCLHNYDYDGYMTEEKLLSIINSLTR